MPAFEGTSAPDWVRSAFGDGLTGVILYGQNVVDDRQLRELTDQLCAMARSAPTWSDGLDPLISIDEEGGDVTRISHRMGSHYPGNAALGAVDDVQLTEQVHRALGADLAELGIGLNLAPSGDVNAVAENPVIGTRAFGADPALVARHTAAAIVGLQGAGVAACVKHFPGHGATRQDSHLELPVVDASRELLDARELVPFRAAIASGVLALMTAHVRVPSLTGSDPATLSPVAMRTLVRGELGFDGVVVTDALDMKAITESIGLEAGAVGALTAGSDLLCLGPIPTQKDVERVVAAIVSAVEDGVLSPAELEASAARVTALRRWVGDARIERAAGLDGRIGLTAARRAVSVSGRVPDRSRPVRVVEVDSPPTISAGDVPWGLSTYFTDTVRVDPAGAASDGAGATADPIDGADGTELVVVVRDAHRNPASRAYIDRLLARHPEAIVVEMGLPVWRPDSRTYIATYGAAAVNARAVAELLGADLAE